MTFNFDEKFVKILRILCSSLFLVVAVILFVANWVESTSAAVYESALTIMIFASLCALAENYYFLLVDNTRFDLLDYSIRI